MLETVITMTNNLTNLIFDENLYLNGSCAYNILRHYKVNISNDKAELYEIIVSVKLLVIVIIDFKYCY